jgi:hypothetical protein
LLWSAGSALPDAQGKGQFLLEAKLCPKMLTSKAR